MLYTIDMLHKHLYYLKNGALVKSWAPMQAPLVKILSTTNETEQSKPTSCKEKVMEVVSPMLTPISQAVLKLESKLKELESSKVDESYVKEMLEMISKALTNQQKEIDELIARQKSEDEEESAVTVACVSPAQTAFLLKFSTQKDFEKAEPCLRSLSDLLEQHGVDFELIEL